MLFGGLGELLGSFFFLLFSPIFGVQLLAIAVGLIVTSFGIRRMKSWALYIFTGIVIMNIGSYTYSYLMENQDWLLLGSLVLEFLFLIYLWSIARDFGVQTARTSKAIIAVSIAAVLIGAGIFAWQYFGAPQGEVRVPEETAGPEVANDAADAVQDWQTYQNEEYGFEVRYPTDWSVLETKGITPYTVFESPDYSGETISSPILQLSYSGARIIINRYENLDNFTLEQLIEDYVVQQNKRNVEIDGVQGIAIDTAVEFGIHETFLVVIKNNLVYQFRRTYPESKKTQYEGVFDQILSTFRFIE